MNEVRQAVAAAIGELTTLERSDMRPVRLLVIGCSTSEITGGVIGKASARKGHNAEKGGAAK